MTELKACTIFLVSGIMELCRGILANSGLVWMIARFLIARRYAIFLASP